MVHIADVTASSGTGATVLVALFALNTPAGQVGTKPAIVGGWTNTATASQGILEVSGLATGATLGTLVDGTPATKAQNTTGVTPATASAYTDTAVNEFTLFVYGDDGGPATLGALSTGYTTSASNVSANSHADLGLGWKNSSNGAETASWALSGTEPAWGTILVAFLLPAGPPVARPMLPVLQSVKRGAYY